MRSARACPSGSPRRTRTTPGGCAARCAWTSKSWPQVGKTKADEQKRLLERAGDDYLVALDEHGKSLTTVELSRWLAERLQDGRNLCFVIGGPDGLGPEILKKAALRWSLSGLTFPHAMVRVILAEQLYRAHSVLHNHPYHRE